MSYKKAERIAQLLRERILSGQMPAGTKLPSYDELAEQFGISRPTISRLLSAMRREGLITQKVARAVYVSDRLPHHHRYFWVTSEQPGSLEWTGFLATFVEVIERQATGLPGQVVPLVGVDGRSNNPAYQQLCEVVKQRSAAGLLLVNSATMYQLPVLQAEGPPRVAIGAALPHSALISLALEVFVDRACARLLQMGKRIAVLSPHEHTLRAVEACLSGRGAASGDVRALHVGVVGCERIAQLLCERRDRPDVIFVTDDNLLEPVLLGMKHARCDPDLVRVLSHCNWPRPFGMSQGVEHLGFDVREIFAAAHACLQALRQGEAPMRATIVPRFSSELTQPLWEARDASVE